MLLPDIESLRCFEAAAVHLNFRVAAAQVALSPAAFSDRIRRLEEVVESPLFERTTRRVELTPAGLRLLSQARRTLEEARRCLDVVRDDGRRAAFEIVLGTRHELGMSWIVPALEELRASRPERTIHLYFGSGSDLLAAVERGSVDAMVSSVRLTRSGLAYANLHEEHSVFVGAAGLMAKHPLSEAKDALHHVLLDAASALPLFRYFLDALDRPEMWSFRRTEILGTIDAVRRRVLDGAGVAVLPRYFVEDDLARGSLAVLVPTVTPRMDAFRLVWRTADARDDEFQVLAEELRRRPLR